MSKISTLKRAGYVSLALGLGLVTTPLISAGNVFADPVEPCEGPTNAQDLNNLISWWSTTPELITLCGNIDGSVNLWGKQTTINLNGYNITSNGQNALSATNDYWGNTGKLTVTGNGNVNGNLSGNLVIEGGSYSVDPSNFVTSPLATYQVNGRWIIDVELDDFTAALSHKAVRVDKTTQITNNLSDLGSKSGITYKISGDDESIISVSNSGTVTGLSAGTASVTVSPSFDPDVKVTLNVSVYDVTAEDETDEAGTVVADTLKEVIDEGGLPKDPKTAPKEAKEVLGEGKEYRKAHEALRTAMGAGETIKTAIDIDDTYVPTDQEVALVEERLSDYDIADITYYDVSAVAKDVEGMPLAKLHKLNNRVIVALAKTSDPADGYARKYLVVHIVNGVPYLLDEGEDYYIENGVLYLITDEFSTFAVTYEDTLIPETKVTVKAPETGASTDTAGSASASLATAAAGSIVAFTLAGAAIFAKRK